MVEQDESMSMTFGIWLKREIEQRLMSQREFAAKAGVSHRLVSYWLADQARPIGTSVVRIANALGVERDIVDERLRTRMTA